MLYFSLADSSDLMQLLCYVSTKILLSYLTSGIRLPAYGRLGITLTQYSFMICRERISFPFIRGATACSALGANCFEFLQVHCTFLLTFQSVFQVLLHTCKFPVVLLEAFATSLPKLQSHSFYICITGLERQSV